jgi:hypothetical protein
LDREFGLGPADDIAAGDHVANVVRIEPDADVFHGAAPFLSCAILTTFERNRNADDAIGDYCNAQMDAGRGPA